MRTGTQRQPLHWGRLLRQRVWVLLLPVVILCMVLVYMVDLTPRFEPFGASEDEYDYGDRFPDMIPELSSNCSRTFAVKQVCPIFFPKQYAKLVESARRSSWTSTPSLKDIKGGKYVVTPFLRALCDVKDPNAASKHGTSNIDTCSFRQLMTFSEPAKPLPLRALIERLRTAGGAECVVGPLNPSDLMAVPIPGPQGAPRWSVFRRECEGRYRDLTRLEVVSVLYHYSRLHAESAAPGQRIGRGFLISGDSMMREMARRVLAFLRGTPHLIGPLSPFLYIFRETGDELREIIKLSGSHAPINEAILSLPRHLRCVLRAYYPGLVQEDVEPQLESQECQDALKGILFVLLSRWTQFVGDESPDIHARFPVAPAMLECYSHWWSGPTDATTVINVTKTYLEMNNARYSHHLAVGTLKSGAAAPRLPRVYVYLTTPERKEGVADNNIVVVPRNNYLRSLPWHPSTDGTTSAGRVVDAPDVHSHLLDFAALAAYMWPWVKTASSLHFMCSRYVDVTDGFLCPDSMNYVLVQWWVRLMAGELTANSAAIL